MTAPRPPAAARRLSQHGNGLLAQIARNYHAPSELLAALTEIVEIGHRNGDDATARAAMYDRARRALREYAHRQFSAVLHATEPAA